MTDHPHFVAEYGRVLTPAQYAIHAGTCTRTTPEQQAAYRAKWRGEQVPPSPRADRPRALPDCPHLGEPVGEKARCVPCGGNVRLTVYACAKYGSCTIGKRVDGVAGCCKGCPENPGPASSPRRAVRAEPMPEITTRHLIYHVYPVSGNGAWQWNVDEICRRLDLFNGKIIVAVATDPPEGRGSDPMGADNNRHFAPCDTIDTVIARFSGLHAGRVEFVPVVNDPQLREVKPLEDLLSRIPTDPGHACLYAQAKGVTRPTGHVSRRWTAALYETLLDYWPLVERTLRTYPVAGSFLKEGRGWPDRESLSPWHYSGSWFWFRCESLFAKDWRRIEQWWGGVETYPSVHFPLAEAGCVFHRGPVPAVNLYSEAYWDRTVTPALAAWKQAHTADQTVAQPPCAGLNLGCGPHYAPGWLNADVVRTDVIHPDVVVNPSEPLPFPAHSFDRCFMGHVLEHIRWEDVPTTLADVARVVRPGGEVLVVGPDFRVALEKLATSPDKRGAISHVWEVTEDHSHYQRESKDRDWPGARHQWNCYAERVVWAMNRAGFVDVRAVPLDPAIIGSWPVVDYTNTSQCAVIGRVS